MRTTEIANELQPVTAAMEGEEMSKLSLAVADNGFEVWQDPALPGQILHNLEEFAHGLRASVDQQEQIKSEMKQTGQQMSQVFGAMSQLLDLMYERLITPPPAEVNLQALQPFTHSMTEAFGEINRRIHSSEERQVTVLEATLRQIERERESQKNIQLTHFQTLKTQAHLELNRLLQVLLVGTAVAAAGAGVAFYIMA